MYTDATVSLGSGSTIDEGDPATVDVMLSTAGTLECVITVTLLAKDGAAGKCGILGHIIPT